MIGLINRGNLPDSTQSEFENFSARLREIFLKEHNEDGTHITQDRVLNFVPVGLMNPWPTATAPSGWLICDGAQVSRATYQGLFNIIGTTYGAGDGSTTFNIPDMRGRFPLGKSASGTGSSLAGTGGNIDHTHTASISSDGAHTHTIGSDGGHTHTVNSHDHGNENLRNGSTATSTFGSVEVQAGTGAFAVPAGSAAFTVAPGSGYDITTDAASPGTDSQGGHSHGGGTGSDGSHTHTGTVGTANPPFLSLNFIIFAGV